MATFPQTITLPVGLADGLTAYASQVTALYSLLIGGVIVPDNDVPWVRALVDDTLTTITVGGTATKDWTVSVAANKACYFTLGFCWSSGTTPALTYRMNGSAITAAVSTTSAATGAGFEAPLYEQAGVPVTYVGHPLADILPDIPNRMAMREQMRLPRQHKVFAFLPGSRQSELRQLAKTFIETARLILEKLPDARFLVPLVRRETRIIFETALWQLEAQHLPITILFGHAHDAVVAADGVLVASGTATLEAALLKRPMVITYKMPGITYWLSKRKKYQPYVGLPNILAGKFLVPELLQGDDTPENLAQALLNLVANKQAD